jgi:hypothetical protein
MSAWSLILMSAASPSAQAGTRRRSAGTAGVLKREEMARYPQIDFVTLPR